MNIKTTKKIIILGLFIFSFSFYQKQADAWVSSSDTIKVLDQQIRDAGGNPNDYKPIPKALPVYQEDPNSQANPNNRSANGNSFNLGSGASSFGSCAGSGALANVIKGRIQNMIDSLGDTRVPTR